MNKDNKLILEENITGFKYEIILSNSSFRLSGVDSGENLKLKVILSWPGTTFEAPVPAEILEIWKLVGSKLSLPESQFFDVNSEIPLHERWNDEIDEYSNGNRIYRDKDGFIISEKEWKEQNK